MEAQGAPHNPRFAVSIRTFVHKQQHPSPTLQPASRPRPGGSRGCHVLGPGREVGAAMLLSGGPVGEGKEAERPPGVPALVRKCEEVCWLRLRSVSGPGVSAPAARRRVTDGGAQPWPRGNLTVAVAPPRPPRRALTYFSPPRPRNSASVCPLSPVTQAAAASASLLLPGGSRRWNPVGQVWAGA